MKILFLPMGSLAAAVVMALAMTAQAAKVTGDMALAAAKAWSAENRSLSAEIGTPVSVGERRDDDGTLLWYEVAMSGGGCIVASADTEIEPVVAVVDKYDGEIPPGHPLEAMLLADMRQRLAVLGGRSVLRGTPREAGASSSAATRATAVETAAADAARKWAKLAGGEPSPRRTRVSTKASAGATTPTTVIRHLQEWASEKLTFWNQFSTYTPNNYPAGCVATAGAALLQFFNVTAAPKFTNACMSDGEYINLTTKGIDYDWSILPESAATYGSFSASQKDLADRAVFDMGVCLGMSYAREGSGASISTLANVLRMQYGFADARYVGSLSASHYEKLIYAQIRSGAPVVLSVSGTPGGHAVLAVGYGEDADSTAYTRVFMGWGGAFDAWYALPNVDDFTSLGGVVTMIGATSDTLAMRGRVTTETGRAAAYADVTVGGKTVVTDENGYWGMRVTPVAGTLSCSCGGTVKSVAVGANAAKIASYSASVLVGALPEAVDFALSDADALIVYTSPVAAVRAALREGKILMVLVGYDGCTYCEQLKTQIKGMGSAFSSDFVLFYANTQVNAYGLDDETYTGSPYWGTFDPRIWKVENRWAAENGRFTINCGYSSASTISSLSSARNQWARLNAAPASLAVSAPGQIAIPTVLAAKLSFPDGTETTVGDGVTWRIVSGTAATIKGDDILSPVEGASGDVTVRCEGYFWNAPYTATKTIRVIDGVAAAGLVIEGPDLVDLLNVQGAQYSAKAILSDGSRVEVPVSWDVIEAKSTNCTMSASGCLSFRKSAYSGESSVRVTARYGDCSAAADVTIWGATVKVHKYTLSDMCAWPGKTVSLTIDQVQWWRHGGWEEPTDEFAGVGVYWYCYVGDTYLQGSSETSRTISLTVPPDDGSGTSELAIFLRVRGRSAGEDLGYNWIFPSIQYVPRAPSQTVTVTFDGNGGDPATQTATYAVGYPYSGFPDVCKTGYSPSWYTAAEGGKQITTSSNCLSSVTRLYARWSPRFYYIEYDANGGAGSMSRSFFNYDRPANLSASTFAKEGAMFAGWATTPNGPVVYQDKEEVLNLSSDYTTITLYAVWVENGYKIVFDANGGTGKMSPQMCSVGTCSRLKRATFARRGATLAGWARTPNGRAELADGGEVCDLASSCGETVTLYAVWNLPAVTAIELAGPDAIDLYDVESAQFTAVCRLANGTVVDVAPRWTIEETAVTNAVISSDGLVVFPDPTKYGKASRLRVAAECNGVSASKEVDVWGWSVSLSSWTSPQRVVWPGQTAKVVPQTVTWWRHGVKEEPTEELDDVDVSICYGWINNSMHLGSDNLAPATDGIAMQIPSVVSEPEGGCSLYIRTSATRLGHVIAKDSWVSFKYLPSAPAQMVDVTFVADGGVPAMQTAKYAADYTYGYFPGVVRTGYFCSWYTAAEGGTRITTDSNCQSSVTRLYARWSPEYYYIDYDANGGIGSMSSSYFFYDSPANLRANTFTKDGAMFAGWATSPDGPVVYQDEEEILNLSSVYARIRLYAVWSSDFYIVAFDANGGTGTMASQSCAPGACLALPVCTFSCTGYSFAGWAETRDGAAKYADRAQVCDLSASAGETVTLYAVWTANTYAVTLNQQNGSGGTTSVAATYGGAMPAITVPTRAGYVFEGYYTSTGGGGTQYYTASGASARTWDRPRATTLYAKWSPTYTVTYRPGANGSGTQLTAVKAQGVALTLEDAIFTRTGYSQTGWATVDGGAKAYELRASYTVNAALTLYPFWTANVYVVTLDAQSGTNGTESVTATYGAAMPAIATPKRDGYTFGGYYTGKEGVGTQYYTADGSSSRRWDLGFATTLYALWTVEPDPPTPDPPTPDPPATTYNVVFDANGGTGTMAAQTIMVGAGAALSANAFAKGGSVFLGWSTTAAGAAVYADRASVEDLAAAGGSVTLYAQWAVEKYMVAFNRNGGTLPKKKKMAAQTMTYGQAAKLRKNVFTRTGHVFAGWAVSKSDAKKGVIAYVNQQSVSNLRTDGGTTTLYAVWAKPTYKVAFSANGGKGAMAVESFAYGKAKKLSANKFKKNGSTFAGWAKSKADARKGSVAYKNKAKVKNLVTTGKTVKLYAVWKKK